MRILVDLQSCQSGSRKGGIGRYSMELAKAMARRSGQHELWLALSSLLPEPIAEIRSEFSDLVCQDRIRVFDVPPSIAELTSNKAKVRAAELVREEFLNSLRPDVIHVSSLFEGLQEDVVTSVGKLYQGANTAVTLYDLIPLVQRDRYLANKDALNHYLGKINNLKEAGLLLSISEFSRDEAIDILGISPEKIVNISSAADERFRPLVIPKNREISLFAKYGISRKFLMYTGSFDQRKNQARLIEAYSLLPGKIRKNYQLVIVGNGWDAIYQELRAIAKRSGLGDDELVFAGHVSDEDLLPLYNLCHLFVFPSLAEGFGLPILEAMSCGTPAIGSNCTSIPEVIGWSEALFDPRNVESMARKISDVLTDEGFYNRLCSHGLEQSKKFSWDESARIAIDAFESRYESSSGVFNGHIFPKNNSADIFDKLAAVEGIAALPDGALLEMAQSIASNQHQSEIILATPACRDSNLKVGWVTTWNTKCGIAAYSEFLVKHFPSEVVVFAPQADETVRLDEANVVRCWQAGEKDNLQRLFTEIKRSKVEVVIIQFNYSFFDFSSFASFLQLMNFNGIRVYITFHSTFDPSDSKRLVVLKDSLSICDGLIVHSMNDVNVLKKYGLADNVNFLPQGILEIKPSEIASGLSFKEEYVIATYGFALPSKGLKETVEAFAMLLRTHGKNFHLLMVNAEYPDPISAKFLGEIRVLIKELGIEDCVTIISDYLPDDVSLGYLRHADLIVYSYQKTGESSSAAVRMGLAAKRPVVVTPVNIFNDVKSSVFFFSGCGVDEISTGIYDILMRDLSSDVDAIRVRENAQLWVSAHRYSSISRQLYWLLASAKSVPIDYYLAPLFSLTQESEKQCFIAGTNSSIRTSVGKILGESIQTTGKQGCLIFGPFISVGPGSYKVVIRGSVGDESISDAVVDVAIKSGTCILANGCISESGEQDIVAALYLDIPEEGCKDLEVRVWVSDNTDLQVSMVEIAPSLNESLGLLQDTPAVPVAS